MRKILVLILMILTLGACSSVVNEFIKSPTVSIKAVNLQNLNAKEATINFSLAVKNPNAFAIKTDGLDYALVVNGIKVANGALNNKLNLGAGSTSSLQLPVSFGFSNIRHLVPQILSSRKIDYKIGGSIHTPLVNLPFSKSGKLGL